MLDWNKIKLKYLKIGPYGIAAFVIIIFATSLRLLLIYQGWPQTNSDESTMGLMALHIAYRGEHPIFFYGQGYMGSLEAYLAAVFFQLFGPSIFALRLGVILMFAVFLASMYLLTGMLYTKKMALAVLVLLSLGPYELLFLEILAAGGYPEMLLFGSLLLLVASWLAFSSRPDILSTPPGKWRAVAYGGWGFLVGVAIWSDLLILPFVFTAGLLIIRFCRSELIFRPPTNFVLALLRRSERSEVRRLVVVLSLLLGLVIGLSPMIVYNATVPLHDSTFGIISIAIPRDAAGHVASQPPLAQKLAGTLLVALPKATGAGAVCSLPSEEAWPLTAHSSPNVIQCTIIRTAWGLGFLILCMIATFLAVRALWKRRQAFAGYSSKSGSGREHAWSDEERQNAIRHFARLMLLVSAGLTLLIFALSAPAALTPLASSRYLMGLLVTTPAVICPLWSGINIRKSASLRFTRISLVLRYAALLLIGTSFLFGTVSTFSRIPGAQSGNQQQEALAHDLLHTGITRIYSDYWTCDRIIFESREQMICSALDEQLQPGYDRYLPYRSIVRADPRASYVFPVNSPQANAFAQKAVVSGEQYQHFTFDNYVVYQPT
jgi:hypothetical protein